MNNSTIPIPPEFRCTCNVVPKTDQMSYIWPFPQVNCFHNSKLELRNAEKMGLGVFTSEEIRKGEYLCCYFGKVTHIAEEYSDYTFDLVLPNNVYSVTIDSKALGNISRYFNHSYQPNCDLLTEYHYEKWQETGKESVYNPGKYWQYTPSKEDANNHYYYCDSADSTWDRPDSDLVRWPISGEEPHIVFYAARDIKKNEQLFINYGKAYWQTREKKLIET